jgi:Predicted inhibitor of MCP methylation, homolog of CheC
MFTQLFGSYLLNKKSITAEQLKYALEYQKNVHLKLGVIAVNSGFMTAESVNQVHSMQCKVDKKFGELAIEMGFLDEEKLNILLNTQKSDYLLLGQALIEKEYMTLEQFGEELNNYKKDYSLNNEKFNSLQNENIDEIIDIFYNFNDSPESSTYKSYLSIFIKNIIRFIDANFKPVEIIPINEYKLQWGVSQEVIGETKLYTYIAADEKSFIDFAGKYAKETYTTNNEYAQAAVGEFLNLVNGLYLVNMSNNDVELELTPQNVLSKVNLKNLSEGFCIPLDFSFGRIDIIIAM